MSNSFHCFCSTKKKRNGLFIYEYEFEPEEKKEYFLVDWLRTLESNMLYLYHPSDIDQSTLKEIKTIFIDDDKLFAFWLEQPHFIFKDNKIFIISTKELSEDIKVYRYLFHV